MKVDGKNFRSIWVEGDGWTIGAIDQRRLPHEFVIATDDDVRGVRRKRSVPCWCAARH